MTLYEFLNMFEIQLNVVRFDPHIYVSVKLVLKGHL
jgi:hypothetical protein